MGRKTWQRGESCAEEWAPPVQRRGVGGRCDGERHGGEAEAVPADGEAILVVAACAGEACARAASCRRAPML